MTSPTLKKIAFACCASVLATSAMAADVPSRFDEASYAAAFDALVASDTTASRAEAAPETAIGDTTAAEFFTFTEDGLGLIQEPDGGVEISNVPVPGSLLLLGTALGALAISRSRARLHHG